MITLAVTETVTDIEFTKGRDIMVIRLKLLLVLIATVLLAGCLALSSWTILSIVGLVAPLVSDPRAAAVLGVLALPLPIAALRLLLDVCLRDGIRAWMVPHSAPAQPTKRRFVFATVGLETGAARFLTFGDGRPHHPGSGN